MPFHIRGVRGYLAVAVCLVALPLSAANPIQIENAKPGHSSWMLSNEALNGEIEGYASATSINRGETIDFHVSTVDSSFTLSIYRMGWYGGAGARLMHGPVELTGKKQTVPTPDPTTGMVACNWTKSYSLTVPNTNDPTDFTSGFYIAKLISGTLKKQKFILFVVRDDERRSNHYFQAAVTTYQAYNAWGGKSLYPHNSTNKQAAVKVSFNRPYDEGAGTGQFLWRWEYSMTRFLEREGYDVTYSTNIDTARRGALLQNHRAFLSVGHDEYWSWEMRTNVESALASGVSLAFFSANNAYWQVRFESDYRTMVGYKETALSRDPYALDSDTSNDHLITTLFRSAQVGKPEAALIGVQYVEDQIDGDIVVQNTWHGVFAYTDLEDGDILPGLLGYEVDARAASTPAGTTVLARSPFVTKDTGVSGNAEMTIYTAPSGAHVFATGSIQWAWGLDSWNAAGHGDLTNADAQQITRNVLRELAGSDASRDCSFALSEVIAFVGNGEATRSFTVTTTPGCSWSATTTDSWLTITAGSGSGTGTVTYRHAANTGASRRGTITVGDQTHLVDQAPGCMTALTPASGSSPASGGPGSVSVSVTPNCAWTAVSNTAWITITSGGGTGPGTVTYSVAPNTSIERTGTLTIAGQNFTITQSDGCVYTLSPTSASFSSAGGSSSVSVSTDAACHWSSRSHAAWITITSSTNGPGNGTVSYTVAQNSGTTRSGNLTIAGKSFTVTQEGVPCSYSISPTSVSIGEIGGSFSVSVTAPAGCFWIARSNSAFLTITSGDSGNGNGTVTYTAAANTTGATRTGSLTVAGVLHSVTQTNGGGPAPRAARYDFDGDGRADVWWRHDQTGGSSMYRMNGSAVASSTGISAETDLNWKIAGFGDVNGDGRNDVIWRHATTGVNYVYLMNGATVTSAIQINREADLNWEIAAVADFTGDGKADIFWRNRATGQHWMYVMNGAAVATSQGVGSEPDLRWQAIAADDFTGDGKADMLWRHTTTGENRLTIMNGADVSSTNTINVEANLDWKIVGVADFTGDGKADVLWRNGRTGENVLYRMNGATIVSATRINIESDLDWRVVEVADFDGDGRADILWRNARSGANAMYRMNGSTIVASEGVIAVPDLGWKVISFPPADMQPAAATPGGAARYDFDGDGRADIWWRHATNGSSWQYRMNGATILAQGGVSAERDLNWKIAGFGDLNGDGRNDVVWRHATTGQNYAYLMNGTTITTSAPISLESDLNWEIAAVADFSGDAKADLLWRHRTTGRVWMYVMNGTTITASLGVGSVPDTRWAIVGTGDFTGDGRADVLWRHSATGENYLWTMNGATVVTAQLINVETSADWKVAGVADLTGDGRADVLWRNARTGENVLYAMNGATITSSPRINIESDLGWTIAEVADFDGDGRADILWRHATTGQNVIYRMNGSAIVAVETVNTVSDAGWVVAR